MPVVGSGDEDGTPAKPAARQTLESGHVGAVPNRAPSGKVSACQVPPASVVLSRRELARPLPGLPAMHRPGAAQAMVIPGPLTAAEPASSHAVLVIEDTRRHLG
ncbi:MAG: hypothetical protein M0Z95_07980 [Actinomycetota bacterium]|nr:hypothetical protein [Actinomycetota bacterium]